ncbi:MAG: pyridoxal phosphate-dependent aminotransferase [Chloroflexi bacterium]|nr:MAG: pyridoxal phosphate-dependent aminotransferase [Chloroflexota bacterium]
MTYTQRIAHLKPEGAYQVLAKSQALEKAGREIIHFEIGQPDFDTFENIRDAGIQAISTGQTRYTPPAGMLALKEAIAEAAGKERGLSFLPEQIVIGPGAKPLLFFPAMALIEPGDEVIYPNPGFPTYEAMIGVMGGVPVPVPLKEEKNFSFDLEAFDRLINERTRMIILNSPGNPTGGVIPTADLEHIAEAAKRYDAWVLSDEIYARIVYDGLEIPSIAGLPGMLERTIIVDGFSKTYAMTGWRLGYRIMPAGLAKKIDLLLTHSVGCSAHFTQVAGLEAVRGPQDRVREVVEIYQKRRDFIVAGLNKIPGVVCQKPQGAFYVFPNVKAFGKTSSELADMLLQEAGVAVLPGSSFGKFGEGYLRLSYATSMEIIERGLGKMREALESMVFVKPSE